MLLFSCFRHLSGPHGRGRLLLFHRRSPFLLLLLNPKPKPTTTTSVTGGLLLPGDIIPHSSSTATRLSSTTTGGGGRSSSNNDSKEWTEEQVEYLDESGAVIYSGKGVRPAEPGLEGYFMSGGVSIPISDTAAAAKIVEIATRWGWGPDLERHLDLLPFTPSPSQLHRALPLVPLASDTALAVFRWASRQPWYSPSDPTLSSLLDRLHSAGDLDSVQSILEHDILLSSNGGDMPYPSSLNRALLHLACGGRLEPAFSCFKALREMGLVPSLEPPTFDALITLFLSKGLPYKAFEVHESATTAAAALHPSTYDLLVPSLARSGRLDAALKLYHQTPTTPSFHVCSALVDSLAKSGHLDQSLRLYRDMKRHGHHPSASMYSSLIESFLKSGKLDAALELWDEMKSSRGFRPNFALYTTMVEAHARCGKLDLANHLLSEMERSGFLPNFSTYSSLIEANSAGGHVDASMRLYNSMVSAGLKPSLTTYTSLLTLLAGKNLIDLAAKILLEMKAVGKFSVDVYAGDVLMLYIKNGSTDLALRWLRFMGSAGLRANSFLVRQLLECCLKTGKFAAARPLMEIYMQAAAKVDLIMYTSILAHLVRCKEQAKERELMGLLSATKHRAHDFLCGLFMGPDQRKMPVLAFVREFFRAIADDEVEESAGRYFVNVLLNYLVLMGQLNRARCVWKVAYEAKLFPKAIVFDQHIAWSLDVRNLSVGAALAATVHTLHRFRKRMLYYGVVPRRIKLVTGSKLRMVVARALSEVDSPFELSKLVLRAPGDSVMEWFKKPIVQQFLLNHIPSRGDVLTHRLDVIFPSSTLDARSLSPAKRRLYPNAAATFDSR